MEKKQLPPPPHRDGEVTFKRKHVVNSPVELGRVTRGGGSGGVEVDWPCSSQEENRWFIARIWTTCETLRGWCGSVLTLVVRYTRVQDYQSCHSVQTVGVSGIKKRTKPPQLSNNNPIPRKKKYIYGKKTSSREIRGCRNQPPLKGNFKTQDKKINKIFQLKRKRKKKKFLCMPTSMPGSHFGGVSKSGTRRSFCV